MNSSSVLVAMTTSLRVTAALLFLLAVAMIFHLSAALVTILFLQAAVASSSFKAALVMMRYLVAKG